MFLVGLQCAGGASCGSDAQLPTVPLFAAILRIPFAIIAPMIVMVCTLGAYSVNGSLFDVGWMFFFGALGYFFKKLNYPIAPLVLAAVLGDKAEDAFRQSMLFANGSLSVFWSNRLVGTLSSIALMLAAWPLISLTLAKLRKRNAAATHSI